MQQKMSSIQKQPSTYDDLETFFNTDENFKTYFFDEDLWL